MIDNSDQVRQELRDKKVSFRQELVRYLRELGDSGSLFKEHQEDTNNPHGVTKDQVSLRYLENYPMATIADVTDGSSSTHYINPLHLPEASSTHTPETTVNPFIGTPVITTPMAHATGVELNVSVEASNYTYSNVSGMEHLLREYEIQRPGNNWDLPVATWTQGDDLVSTSPIALDYFTTYEVRVRDRAVSGEVSDWSLPVSFSSKQYAIYPLAITAPSNGGGVERGSVVSWDTVIVSDPEQLYTLSHYQLQISDTPDFSNLVVDTSTVDATYTLTDQLEWETELYVRVRPHWSDTARLPEWSDVVSFTIDAYELQALSITAPQNNASVSSGAYLYWTNKSVSDPEGLYTLSHYEVAESSSGSFPQGSTTVHTTPTPSFRFPSAPSWSRKHYRVRPVWSEAGVVSPWSASISTVYVDEDEPTVFVETENIRSYGLKHAVKAHDGGVILYHSWYDVILDELKELVEWRRSNGTKAFYKTTHKFEESGPVFPQLLCWVPERNLYLAKSTISDSQYGKGAVIYWATPSFEPEPYLVIGDDHWIKVYNGGYVGHNLDATAHYIDGEIYVSSWMRGGNATNEPYYASLERVDVSFGTLDSISMSTQIKTLGSNGHSAGSGNLRISMIGGYKGRVVVEFNKYDSGIETGVDVRDTSTVIMPKNLGNSYNRTIKGRDSSETTPLAIVDGYLVGRHYRASMDDYTGPYADPNFVVKYIEDQFVSAKPYITRPSPLGLPVFSSGDSVVVNGGGVIAENTHFYNQRDLRKKNYGSNHSLVSGSYVIDPTGTYPTFGFVSDSHLDGDSIFRGFIDWYDRFDVRDSGLQGDHNYSSDLEWHLADRPHNRVSIRTYNQRLLVGMNNGILIRDMSLPGNGHAAAEALLGRVTAIPESNVPNFLQ